MKNITKILYVVAILALSFASVAGLRTMAQDQGGYVRFVRGINTAELGVAHPVGLTYLPEANAFTVAQETAAGGQSLAVITMYEQRGNSALVSKQSPNPVNMTADSTNGRTFVLDAAKNQIQVTGAGSPASFDLKSLGDATLSSMAFNPADGHLYLMNPQTKNVYKVDQAGNLAAYYDLSSFPMVDPQGMVFAPSGDMTDDPAIMNLFIADTNGQIVEVSFTAPQLVDMPEPQAVTQLINTIHTSQWTPPSPDPAGVDAMHDGTMLVVDSEIDEMNNLFAGTNAWVMNPDGTVVKTCPDTYSYNKEPTGVAVNYDNGEVYIADDNHRRMNVVTSFCTSNDPFYRFDLTLFGITDPESTAYGNGMLFVGDGLNAEVYIINPGPNGIFDGAPGDTYVDPVPGEDDDTATHFDTTQFGIYDLEGMTFHRGRGTLFMVSRGDNVVDNMMVEITTSGQLVNSWNLASLGIVGLGGLGNGPSSVNPSQTSLFIADRGVDNNDDPSENDGRILEFSLDGTTQPPPAPNLDEFIFLPFIMQSGQ